MPEPGARALRVYRAPADAAPGVLAGEAVAVLGYGNLGRSAALNLRDSGVKVRIGNRDGAAREFMRGGSSITEAESRLRKAAGLSDPPDPAP